MKEQLKYYLKLLKSKDIKRILEPYAGYSLEEVNKNSIVLTKETNFKYEKVELQQENLLVHIICEKRPKGIIITELEYLFDTTAYSRGENILVRLSEARYVLTYSKLASLMINTNNLNLKEIYQRVRLTPINLVSDMKTSFSTSMHYMIKSEGGKWVRSGVIPTMTYLNGEDISLMYDTVNGNDKLYRIYDLYNGIMNLRNEKDIKDISLGLLTTDAFWLKDLRGITFKENAIVGKTLDPMNQEDKNYIKNYYIQKVGYNGEIKYDRDSLLECITYEAPSYEIVKRPTEKNTEGLM